MGDKDFGQIDSIYELLPTLGERIIDPVIEELRQSQPSQFAYIVNKTASALLEFAKRNPGRIAASAAAMLEAPELGGAACGGA